jgi:TonB family protein
MKRVLITALICAVFFVCAHRPASATVEFCPATLQIQPVGQNNSKTDRPAQLYGFNLYAHSPRSVVASVAFDTNGGWYTLEVPRITLSPKQRHYASGPERFTRTDFVSQTMYVRFPSPVVINDAWVFQASAQGDGPFGWEKQGEVNCDPSGPGLTSQAPVPQLALDPKDQDALGAAPSQKSMIFAAATTQPIERAACAQPFQDATVTNAVTPDYPDAVSALRAGGVSTVEVDINADGSLADAWVWGPSYYSELNAAALQAARNSKYKPKRAYCRNVPGRYFFQVTFSPNY